MVGVLYIAGDIGGTNSRLQLVRSGSNLAAAEEKNRGVGEGHNKYTERQQHQTQWAQFVHVVTCVGRPVSAAPVHPSLLTVTRVRYSLRERMTSSLSAQWCKCNSTPLHSVE